MCGFFLAYSADAMSGRSGYLTRAMRAMEARGTDEPTFSQGPVAGWHLAHTRLPIQSNPRYPSPQPHEVPGGLMTYVGELFGINGRNEAGHFKEAIFDNSLFSQFDGFWSVVHMDERNGLVHVYTDHLGIKPVYYSPLHRVVSSDIRSIICATGLAAGWPRDQTYVGNVIKFGYDYSARTPFAGIRQMPPGSRLTLNSYGEVVSCQTYYPMTPFPVDLERAFLEAVKNRVLGLHYRVKDSPSLLLSGGLDSSLVFYAIKQLGLADAVNCFTVPNQDDTDFLPPEANVQILSPSTGPDDLEEALRAMQEPLDLGSLVPQFRLARSIHEHPLAGPVVLTGDGADELFGGYRRAKQYDSQFSDVFCELPYYHLPRLDRIHMAFTQEVRSPFLSPKVVQAALYTPRSDRTEKQALKKLASRLGVPQAVIDRPKTPLKSEEVLTTDPITYRARLVDTFYNLNLETSYV